MSARRFRAEEDYFGKRSQLPEELIGSRATRLVGDSQDDTMVSEKDHDAQSEDFNHKTLKYDRLTYLAFRLRGQGYALDASRVKKIIRQMRITPILRTPEYVRGVINLRGKIIMVVDLGLKLGMEGADVTEETCIIVVEVMGSKGPIPLGIVVDSVSEVVKIGADQIQKTPTFGVSADTAYISGMAMLEDGTNILLNIDRLLEEGAKVGAEGHKAIREAMEKDNEKETTVHEKNEVRLD